MLTLLFADEHGKVQSALWPQRRLSGGHPERSGARGGSCRLTVPSPRGLRPNQRQSAFPRSGAFPLTPPANAMRWRQSSFNRPICLPFPLHRTAQSSPLLLTVSALAHPLPSRVDSLSTVPRALSLDWTQSSNLSADLCSREKSPSQQSLSLRSQETSREVPETAEIPSSVRKEVEEERRPGDNAGD
jgi:hypothetical protein